MFLEKQASWQKWQIETREIDLRLESIAHEGLGDDRSPELIWRETSTDSSTSEAPDDQS